MNATLFLRIASVLSLVQCVLHTVGGVFGSPKDGAEEIAVIETMKSRGFDVMGSTRRYWDFLFGYLFVTIDLLVQTVLFWQLAAFVKANPVSTRPIVVLFFFNCVGVAIVSWKYFFVGPAVTQLLVTACLSSAFANSRGG